MRAELLLPLTGVISGGLNVRRAAAAAISSVEKANRSGPRQKLADFFVDAANKSGATPAVTLPATSAVIASGVKVVAPVTGTFVNGITATVVAGVITGFVLS